LPTDAPFTTVGAAATVVGAVVAGAVLAGAVGEAVGEAVVGDVVTVLPGVAGVDDCTTPAGSAIVPDALVSVAAKAYASPLVVTKLSASAALRE
jgi:hypothetical protein